MQMIAALFSGLIFGIGLVLSEMINPRRVLGFLDVAGAWDPTLLFVMAGAVTTTFIGYQLVLRRPVPLFAGSFSLPSRTDLDFQLVAGAAIFGLGWGLAGFCPGPAITALAIAGNQAIVFVAAMVLGMVAANSYGRQVVRRSGSGNRD